MINLTKQKKRKTKPQKTRWDKTNRGGKSSGSFNLKWPNIGCSTIFNFPKYF